MLYGGHEGGDFNRLGELRMGELGGRGEERKGDVLEDRVGSTDDSEVSLFSGLVSEIKGIKN